MNLHKISEDALAAMTAAGFEASQVAVSSSEQDELNVALNEASLLRSTEDYKLSLTGIVDGRRASTEMSDLSAEAMSAAIEVLYRDTLLAPQDDANVLSENQVLSYLHGPQESDLDLLADKVVELLEFRRSETPLMKIEEGAASHRLTCTRVLTSGGTELDCSVGAYGLSVMGTASDGDRASSLNETAGSSIELQGHATEYFGIGEMLRATERQIYTRSIDGNFVGEVVLTPHAVTDVLEWLLLQLGDTPLIAGTSVFRDSVGNMIAAPLLNVSSRFDGPGIAPVSADACVADPVDVIRNGKLMTLLPSLYGSRKTGLPHQATGSGWQVGPGDTPRDELSRGINHGAWVGRLSMGRPAANGNFSGVIKSSFEIVDGQRASPLAEVMISGNMAQMLSDISAISRETLDTGDEDLPWIRIGGLHFS